MPLVDYDEQVSFLDLPSGTDKELIEDLLVQTTALFEKECGRSSAPFSGALTGRVEIQEALSGSGVLTLDYPIATVTSIASGVDVATPDELLSAPFTGSVIYQVGSRDLIRVDGGVWRRFSPRWVKVTYNTLADYPADAKLAVKRMVAQVYHGRGKEGFASVTRGSRSWSIADSASEDRFWLGAVNNHRRAWLR